MPKLQIDFHPQAEKELREAIDWYGERNLEVADRFLKEIQRLTQRIAIAPALFPSRDGNTRSALVIGFPYQVVFRVKLNSVQIIAVAHAKRHPNYWQHRIEPE